MCKVIDKTRKTINCTTRLIYFNLQKPRLTLVYIVLRGMRKTVFVVFHNSIIRTMRAQQCISATILRTET